MANLAFKNTETTMKEKLMIYQVLPRLYGNKKGANVPAGTLKENGCGKMNDFTSKELNRIRDFGFTHIWYTGLLEHATMTDYSAYGIARDHSDIVKGRAGSPYAIKDYYDIDPDLAVRPEQRMQEFEALLKRTHKAGLKLVMDFVPNHVARQYETVKLNYGIDYCGGRVCHFSPVPNTWEKMTAILLFWAAKGVDAFRCDMAEMVPCEFWHYAIAKVKEQFKNVVFIAEVYNPGEYRRYIHEGGFDYLYDKVGLYDALRAVVCRQASSACITGCWQQTDDIHEHMLNFLENHDEQRIASDFFAGDAERALPALVVSACMNTNPFMVYAGQELGERGMDVEGFSGRDGRTTIFDYWCVKSMQQLAAGMQHFTPEEKKLYTYYRKVVRLCNDSSAIREGLFYDLMHANYDHTCSFDPGCHYAFIRKCKRETLFIVANFSDVEAHIGVRIPANAFEYLSLRGGLHSAIDLLSGETQTIEFKADHHTFVTVPANGAIILKA